MTARQAFQEAVRSVVTKGKYPGPLAITTERDLLFHEGLRHRNTLNAQEMGWRAEALIELGWAPTHRMPGDVRKWAWRRPKK